MELRRIVEPDSFLQAVGPFLLRQEAAHNLMLGIASALPSGDQPRVGVVGRAPYLAAVEEDGAVVVAALRTPPMKLILSQVDGPTASPMAVLAEDLLAEHSDLPSVLGPVEASRGFAERWAQVTGRTAAKEMALRIYQLERVGVGAAVSTCGTLRRATPADRDLVVHWVRGFRSDLGEGTDTVSEVREAERIADRHLSDPRAAEEAGGDAVKGSGVEGLYLWLDREGRPVSMAACGGATPSGLRVNFVYTPPHLRRRGYASACVAGLSQLVLDSGRRYCFLFTDLANLTSNHIYQQIGYHPVCDVDEYAFSQRDGERRTR